MNENENLREQEPQELNLDDIMKEFAPEEGEIPENTILEELEQELSEEIPQEEPQEASDDTVRVELPPHRSVQDEMGDTVRLENIEQLAKEAKEAQAQPEKAEP